VRADEVIRGQIARRGALAAALRARAGTALAGLRKRWGWLALPIGIGLVVRLALLVLVAAGMSRFSPAGYSDPLHIWLRKDAVWYLNIVRDGYYYSSTSQSSANFFPLYPLLVRAVRPTVAPFVAAPDDATLVAGMLVAWAAFLADCALLYRLAWDSFGRRATMAATLLLALYPFGYYFGAAFTESLYLFLALVAFLAIERGRWWLAGSAALLAGAARPPGLVMGLCVALAYALDWLRTRHAWHWNALALALTPLGAAAYVGYCWLAFGTPTAYLRTSEAGWHRGHLKMGGLLQAWQLLTRPGDWIGGYGVDIRAYGVYAVLLLLVLATVPLVAQRLGVPYALYTLVGVFAPIVTVESVESLGRYISVLFPIFLIWGYLLARRPRTLTVMAAISAAGLLLFAVLFVVGPGLA
jgi:hypothetical protein